MSAIKCTAAGDAMVLRRLPGEYPGFNELKAFIEQGDFRCVNMETTIHNHETYGAAISGGTWFSSPPGVLEDAKTFGFNILTTCNNHAMDYSHIGLEKTMDYVEKAGFQNPGVGRTLADAAAPVYMDTMAGRIAVIGACSTFHEDAMAGEQTRTMMGRPGINAIRYNVTYQLPQEQLDQLKAIASAIGINGSREIIRKEGYLPPLPADKAEFGELLGTLESKEEILELVSTSEGDDINVLIGSESSVKVMNNSSLVFTPIKKNGRTVGVIGVLGPRRMNYKQVLQTLGDIGGSISQMMDEDKQLAEGKVKKGDNDGGN